MADLTELTLGNGGAVSGSGGEVFATSVSGQVDHSDDLDCAGDYYGDALIDECGVCNGDGAVYECGCSDIAEDTCDCEGNVLDECGVCGGDGSSCLEATLDMAFLDGWNWFSLNVQGDNDFMQPSNLLGSSTNATAINDLCNDANPCYMKNQQGFDEYLPGWGWWPDAPMSVTATYKLYSQNEGNISITAEPVPLETEIALGDGWNWISYLPQELVDVPTALLSLLTEDDTGATYSIADLLKNQNAFTQYFSGWGWFGDALTYMEPGVGYILHTIEEGVLQYPDPSDFIGGRIFNEDFYGESNIWSINAHDYQYNGTISASVSIDGIKASSVTDQLAIFVGDECRGFTHAAQFPVTGEYVFPLMAYSNDLDEEMSFRFYDSRTGSIYEDIANLTFTNDMIIGSALETLDLVFNTYTEGPSEFMISSAYPNPFNPSTSFEYHVANDGFVDISVYDVSGRLVEELVNGFMSVGDYKVTWSAYNQSSGVYFVRFNADGFTQTQKIMLVK